MTARTFLLSAVQSLPALAQTKCKVWLAGVVSRLRMHEPALAAHASKIPEAAAHLVVPSNNKRVHTPCGPGQHTLPHITRYMLPFLSVLALYT